MRGFHHFFLGLVLTTGFLICLFNISDVEAGEIAIDLSAEYQTITTADLWKLVKYTCDQFVVTNVLPGAEQAQKDQAHTACTIKLLTKISPIPSRSI